MVTVDTVIDLLDSEQRRYALYYLEGREEPVSIEELAEEVAKMESDAGEDHPTDEEISHYKITFRHADLPKADEASFIHFDADEGIVQMTGEPPEFKAILTVAEVMEKPL